MNKKIAITTGTIALALLTAPAVLANEADTSFEKQGTEIKVQNPSVEVTTSDETIWADVNVKVDDIKIPDEIQINQGDSITVGLPKELILEKDYSFPVNNDEGTEVGQATAYSEKNEVTTVFNDYFESHPLNKTFSLEIGTKWNRKLIKENQDINLDINGSTITKNTGTAPGPDATEVLTKWGSEDKDHPGEIHWWIRVNYAKKNLINVNIADTWDENQEYVDGTMNIAALESYNPWVNKESEVTKIKLTFNKTGFNWTVSELADMLMFDYRTKVTSKSEVYLNNVTLKAQDLDVSKEVGYKVVKGSGSASGNKEEVKPEKPTFELPNEAPVHEKPEWKSGVVPNEAPIHEKPEWKGGVVPNEAPIHDKPEWEGGVVPNEAPIHEKPEREGGVIPNEAPTHKLPKLEIPEIPTDTEEPSKPSQQVTLPKHIAEAKEKLVEAQTLPNTGHSKTIELAAVMTGAIGLALASVILKKEEK